MIDYASREICSGVTTRQLQLKSLEILKYFQKICDENNLRYWGGGGTCIGALRHKGFIPWDDDIDIFMPRPDYEKLYEIWDSVADTARYTLCRTNREQNNHQTDMQLVDVNTTFINHHSVNEDIRHGISIDIMPMEGCPKSKLKQALQIYHSVIYSIYNVQRLPDHQGKLLRVLTKIMLDLIPSSDKRYRLWKKHEKIMAKYDFDQSPLVKETITSFRGLFRSYPRDFFETKEVPFEDTVIKIPVGAHEYMSRIFRDYMSWPPEEQRAAKHDVVFISLTEPYKKYKGVYYCVNEESNT